MVRTRIIVFGLSVAAVALFAIPSGAAQGTVDAPSPLVTADAGVGVSATNVDGVPAYRYIALGTAIAGWVGAGVLGLVTLEVRDDANKRYPTDPDFESKRDRYTAFKWTTVGSLGLGVIASAITVYLFATADDGALASPTVGLTASDGTFGITYGGTFGGAR